MSSPEDQPYAVTLSGQARRNIREHLPFDVATAAMETIRQSIAVNPYRTGKPLNEPFDGYYSARRGTYRILHASTLLTTMSRSIRSDTDGGITLSVDGNYLG